MTDLAWRKSSYCANGTCVEVAGTGSTVHVRDGKQPGGHILDFPVGDWRGFLEAIRGGEYDQL